MILRTILQMTRRMIRLKIHLTIRRTRIRPMILRTMTGVVVTTTTIAAVATGEETGGADTAAVGNDEKGVFVENEKALCGKRRVLYLFSAAVDLTLQSLGTNQSQVPSDSKIESTNCFALANVEAIDFRNFPIHEWIDIAIQLEGKR